jgi:5-oxoprolinase (ATP-hydrolysing) subunit A
VARTLRRLPAGVKRRSLFTPRERRRSLPEVALTIDLNADVGEGLGAWTMGDDRPLLTVVTSVNVACGFHAGDPRIMDATVAAAMQAGVAIGAHPGYRDLHGFGRREMAADPSDVEADVVYQIGALAAFAHAHGTALTHVKPHGALYNQAARDPALARAVARGVKRAGGDLVLVGLASSSVMRAAAEGEGLRFAAEAFADRAYEADGSLRSRRLPGAVLSAPQAAARQAVRIVRDGLVTAADGSEVPLRADTLCVHGDTPGAVAMARAVRGALEGEGIALRALGQ